MPPTLPVVKDVTDGVTKAISLHYVGTDGVIDSSRAVAGFGADDDEDAVSGGEVGGGGRERPR